MTKKPYTTKELFGIVDNLLKENNLIPDIVEYGIPASEAFDIKTYHFDVVFEVRFGSSEGIYLDIFLDGKVSALNNHQRYRIGTYKTLAEDRFSFKHMAELGCEFVFAAQTYINANIDDFCWVGCDVEYFDANEKLVRSYRSFDNDPVKTKDYALTDGFYDYNKDYYAKQNLGKPVKLIITTLCDRKKYEYVLEESHE